MRSGLYLGSAVEGGGEVVLEPRALTTHGFVVGMTGSGKTGLCSVLVEEALSRGVPVIAVDPKGDIGNLLIAPDPAVPQDFAPWIDPDAARREGKPLDELARALSQRALKGLEESRLTRDDVLLYRHTHEARIYTPGARIGAPVNVIGSLAPPQDPGALADTADGLVRAVLGLLGIDADPVRSREYILLFGIVESAWKQGRGLSLEELVRLVADPPFDTVGALPLESFFPKKERTPLTLALNGLVASPSFEPWRAGAPIDVASMLRTADGRPCLSVFSTAHLPDEQKIFATALLLDRVRAWAMRQPGTGELRALLYIDEIYGYFPPHPADPATKKPLLALLKQARAFGLGVVLATQNPVDLDYKGLANIGTWFVGRLQTENDKARIREGIAAAASAGGQDARELDRQISSLGPRQFLLHSVHRPKPELFRTRWAFSFLRGPLGRDEIARLSGASDAAPTASAAKAAVASSGVAVPAPTPSPSAAPPAIDEGLGPLFMETTGPCSPFLMVKFAVRYRLSGVATEEKTYTVAFPLAECPAPGESLEGTVRDLEGTTLVEAMPAGLAPAPGPSWLREAKLPQLQKVVRDRLPSKLEARLFFDPETKLLSQPTESKDAFASRVAAVRGQAKSTGALSTKLEKKKLELAHAQEMVEARKKEKWLSIGGAVVNNLGLVFGKKRTVSGVSSVMSKDRMAEQAENKVETLTTEIAALEAEVGRVTNVDTTRFEERRVVPAAKDVSLLRVAVAYLP